MVKNNFCRDNQLQCYSTHPPSYITIHLDNELTTLGNLVVMKSQPEINQQLVTYECSTSSDKLASSGSSFSIC